MDLRSRGKVPYGYKIVNGKAEIDEGEAERLKFFFDQYLEGDTMREASKNAGLPYNHTALPHLFKRKEYLGTDFYPPLITADFQDKLISEWLSRKGEHHRGKKKMPRKVVRIYTDFTIRKLVERDAFPCTAEYMTALYLGIVPVS